MKRVATIIALLLFAGPLLRAEGAAIPITITNFSFENPALGSVGAYTNTGTLPGWTLTANAGGTGTGGVYDVGAVAPDGVQVGWFFRSTLWQQTSAQLTNGAPYQLNLAVGRDVTGTGVDATYALYSGNSFVGGTLLASGTISPPDPAQNFQNVTLTFGPGDPNYATILANHAGENIIVAFTASTASNASADVDNVQLSVVPEPATLHLLGVGGLMLWRNRRSRR